MKVANIEREREELEKIELIIRSILNPDTAGVLTKDEQGQLLTSGGNVRDIVGWAVKILSAAGVVMTASEISEVMYSYSWSIDLRSFKRRVIVGISASANLKDPSQRLVVSSGLKAPNREVRWALPSWMDGEVLLDKHLPKPNRNE